MIPNSYLTAGVKFLPESCFSERFLGCFQCAQLSSMSIILGQVKHPPEVRCILFTYSSWKVSLTPTVRCFFSFK
eukprot:UN23556